MLMTMHLLISSRILLSNPSDFNQFCLVIGQENDKGQDEVASRLLNVWCDKMANATQPEQKKLLSLALCSLMTSGSSVVLNHIFAIFINILETLNDITRQDEETGAIIEYIILFFYYYFC